MVQKGYFGLLGNTYIMFIILLYPIKGYVYRVERMDIVKISLTH